MGDRVTHYVDGDIGTVVDIGGDAVTVLWSQEEGTWDHYSDELSKL